MVSKDIFNLWYNLPQTLSCVIHSSNGFTTIYKFGHGAGFDLKGKKQKCISYKLSSPLVKQQKMANNHTSVSCCQDKVLLCNRHVTLQSSYILLFHRQELRKSRWPLFPSGHLCCTVLLLSMSLDLSKNSGVKKLI